MWSGGIDRVVAPLTRTNPSQEPRRERSDARAHEAGDHPHHGPGRHRGGHGLSAVGDPAVAVRRAVRDGLPPAGGPHQQQRAGVQVCGFSAVSLCLVTGRLTKPSHKNAVASTTTRPANPRSTGCSSKTSCSMVRGFARVWSGMTRVSAHPFHTNQQASMAVIGFTSSRRLRSGYVGQRQS